MGQCTRTNTILCVQQHARNKFGKLSLFLPLSLSTIATNFALSSAPYSILSTAVKKHYNILQFHDISGADCGDRNLNVQQVFSQSPSCELPLLQQQQVSQQTYLSLQVQDEYRRGWHGWRRESSRQHPSLANIWFCCRYMGHLEGEIFAPIIFLLLLPPPLLHSLHSPRRCLLFRSRGQASASYTEATSCSQTLGLIRRLCGVLVLFYQ